VTLLCGQREFDEMCRDRTELVHEAIGKWGTVSLMEAEEAFVTAGRRWCHARR
jgi:hypothetical protein